MLDLFSAFDYPDASMTVEQRPTTTSPIQALYLMNSPLVLQASAKLAQSAIEAHADSRERIRALYEAAHGRAPQSEEVDRALGFIARLTEPREDERPRTNIGEAASAKSAEERLRRESTAWSLFAQVLLVSNEFLFVD
jgi:hypothetical protein